jgi:ATPase subunit of ABC transporter with duplicated ATPase domains
MLNDQNKKSEDKIAELKSFIARFSSNASKAKQATSRKKMLDKIKLEDIKPSSRRYPFVTFTQEREVGKDILIVSGLSKTINGVKILNNISFIVNKNDKIIILGKNELARTTFFKILMGEMEPDEGSFKWGITTTQSYLPKDNTQFFEGNKQNLVDWLRQYSGNNREEQDESFIRGFLGKMLFSGDDALKEVNVLSGGEKVRCMLSKMMLGKANVVVLDEPTNHLDLESIQAVNDGLISFKGNVIFTSHDHRFIQTVANRVLEITPNGLIDKMCNFDEYLENEELQAIVKTMYKVED